MGSSCYPSWLREQFNSSRRIDKIKSEALLMPRKMGLIDNKLSWRVNCFSGLRPCSCDGSCFFIHFQSAGLVGNTIGLICSTSDAANLSLVCESSCVGN